MMADPNHTSFRCLAACALWALVACTTAPRTDVPTRVEVDGEAAASARTAPPKAVAPPPEIMEALLPSIARPDPSARKPDAARFDVTVDRAPARQFFMSLVEGTEHSIALAPGVEGQISLSLRDVTVEEVLETVQQAYGYGFERTRSGYLVLPTGLQTRVFRLDYLNLTRVGSSDTRVSSGQISDQISGDDGAQAVGGAVIDDSSNSSSVSGSRIRTESQRDLWHEILDSVTALVGGGEGRQVVASPNAGLLVVRGLPGELAKVASFLRSAESSLNRVVILEAKILEVTLDDGIQTGINWGQLATPSNDTIRVGQNGGGSVNSTGFSETRGVAQEIGPPLSDLFLGGMTSAFGGVFSLALEVDKFSAFIELLERQGEVRTLSNPRISTVNNQKAVIKVGSDEFFVTDVSTTTVTGTATTSSPNVTLTPFFSGIALDVTPQISDDDEVILHVHPAVTEVSDQTKTFTIDGATQTLPLALSNIRESDSIVRARSGQIVVIGGLIQNDARDTTFGIPFLSRLPWIGRLFAHSNTGNLRTELVILLRPIVVADGTWQNELRDTSRRIHDAFGEIRGDSAPAPRLEGWLPPAAPSRHDSRSD